MFHTKPTSRFNLYTLITLFLLLSCTIFISASEDSNFDIDNEDELEELIAIDEQGESDDQQHKQQQGEQLKEAQVLSKAQRIVLELNGDNAKKVIDGNKFVMVLGYAPWCSRSAELMPHFAEAANMLKELGSDVLMTKLDAERYPKVASSLQIKGFPTLLLFLNGTSQAYTGGFTGEDIVIWIRKKTGTPVVRLGSVDEATEFSKKYHSFVIGLFQKFEGSEYQEFVKAATSDNEIQFVAVSDVAVAKVLFPDIKAKKHFIGLVKAEPERYTSYEGDFEMDEILQFLDHNKFPLITKLTELNSVKVYSSPVKLQVTIFADADFFKNHIESLQEVARKFKSKVMFIYIDITDENLAKPFLTLFGLEDADDTVVAAFDNQINTKYLLEADPTPSNIQDFSSKLSQGNLSPFFKSQPVPDNKEANVTVVVGKTFTDMVLNSPKNVLLEVHTPWCINCETTSKQVEKLAKHFKGLDSLLITRFDASANEHPKLQVDDYPTLLFYPASDKANPIKLSTKSSSKELAATINKHLKVEEKATKDEL